MELMSIRSLLIEFQPTPPSREATDVLAQLAEAKAISTHTSLAGGDGSDPDSSE